MVWEWPGIWGMSSGVMPWVSREPSGVVPPTAPAKVVMPNAVTVRDCLPAVVASTVPVNVTFGTEAWSPGSLLASTETSVAS